MNFSFLSHSLKTTESAGKHLGKRVRLAPEWGKIILLSGELGTGKTSFSRGFLQGLGFPEEMLSSPTFTYFKEYSFEGLKVLHGDLYRLKDDAVMPEFVMEELSEYQEKGYIILLEWADLLSSHPEHFFAESSLRVHLSYQEESENTREVSVSFYDLKSISTRESEEMMDEFMTPLHVRNHIEKVTQVAIELSLKLFEKGVIVDPNLVENGAICHDIVRYVDFPNFDDTSKYKEEVTPEKLNFWSTMKEEYRTVHHADAAADILTKRGFASTGRVSQAHKTGEIFRAEFLTWEEKIVYYSDKRALHDQVVSLKERFEDGRRRYTYEASPELERKVYALEKEIFSYLDIGPEDIK